MNEESLIAKKIETATNVKALVESRGWVEVKKLWEEMYSQLSSIEDVTSIKQIEGKKYARKVLTDWWIEIQALMDDGDFAKAELDKIKKTKSIYRVR